MCYATGCIPCSDECAEAGYCLLSSGGDMNKDIKHLRNGDFEVERKLRVYKPQIRYGSAEAETGRRPVYWWVDDHWENKGWLMPTVMSSG